MPLHDDVFHLHINIFFTFADTTASLSNKVFSLSILKLSSVPSFIKLHRTLRSLRLVSNLGGVKSEYHALHLRAAIPPRGLYSFIIVLHTITVYFTHGLSIVFMLHGLFISIQYVGLQ